MFPVRYASKLFVLLSVNNFAKYFIMDINHSHIYQTWNKRLYLTGTKD